MQKDEGKSRAKNASSAAALDVLYGNMRIRRVTQDALSGAQTITVACADREDQKIVYHDVLYTQIDQSAEGERIAIAARMTPEEFRAAGHRASAERLKKDCGLSNLDSLCEMGKRGYLVYTHYIVRQDERITIAKGVTFG